MPQIIPIRDLKNTSEISRMCKESSEPIYITKNGYGDMVIMSMRLYEENYCKLEAYRKLDEARKDIECGKTSDASESLERLRNKYGL